MALLAGVPDHRLETGDTHCVWRLVGMCGHCCYTAHRCPSYKIRSTGRTKGMPNGSTLKKICLKVVMDSLIEFTIYYKPMDQ